MPRFVFALNCDRTGNISLAVQRHKFLHTRFGSKTGEFCHCPRDLCW